MILVCSVSPPSRARAPKSVGRVERHGLDAGVSHIPGGRLRGQVAHLMETSGLSTHDPEDAALSAGYVGGRAPTDAASERLSCSGHPALAILSSPIAYEGGLPSHTTYLPFLPTQSLPTISDSGSAHSTRQEKFGWDGMESHAHPTLFASWCYRQERGASKLNIASRNAPTTRWSTGPGSWFVPDALPTGLDFYRLRHWLTD